MDDVCRRPTVVPHEVPDVAGDGLARCSGQSDAELHQHNVRLVPCLNEYVSREVIARPTERFEEFFQHRRKIVGLA